jgi:hypothetical protein
MALIWLGWENTNEPKCADSTFRIAEQKGLWVYIELHNRQISFRSALSFVVYQPMGGQDRTDERKKRNNECIHRSIDDWPVMGCIRPEHACRIDYAIVH